MRVHEIPRKSMDAGTGKSQKYPGKTLVPDPLFMHVCVRWMFVDVWLKAEINSVAEVSRCFAREQAGETRGVGVGAALYADV